MTDDIDRLNAARRAARSFAAAAAETAEFLDRTSGVPTAAQTAEYATLVAREQATYRDRREALHRLGLSAESIGG